MPKTVAALIPGVVALVPPIVQQLGQTQTSYDLITYVIGSIALIVTTLVPRPQDR